MAPATALHIDIVLPHKCLLGEGPVWNAKKKSICWVDILNGIIHQYSPAQKTQKTIPVHQMIGSVAVCSNGNFIAALQNGFAFVDSISGDIKMIADPESHLPGNRFNEGKCDPAGRFWAGTMSLSEEPHAGSVYLLKKDLSVTKKIEAVTISNGMAWSADHQIVYYIDTPTYQVSAFNYDKTTAHISNRRNVINISKEDGYPDGMAIDSEGMLWIAHWDGWQVTRWNPNTGKKLFHIKMPVARVTSCTFGGDDLNDLYITSASTGLTDEEFKKQPLAGSLFVIRNCGFKGMPAVEFII
jgi:sugar lactone lactonase YvrE